MNQFRGNSPAKTAIPIIDVAGLQGDHNAFKRVAKEIHEACVEVGFFYVKNHSVPHKLTDRTFQQLGKFFDLRKTEKEEVHIEKSMYMRGYFSAGSDKSDGILGDKKEGYDMARDLPITHPYVSSKIPFYGPNAWPKNPPDFRETMIEYHQSLLDFGLEMLQAFAVSLNMPKSFFDDKFLEPMAQMRLLRYPKQAGEFSTGIGAGEHTDFGWITLIAQDNHRALQILTKGNEWIYVEPIPDTFVVNVGDLMSIWTNDLYPATMHRVVNENNVK
jgi:isopenicillin N synthase-like dioxygenase